MIQVLIMVRLSLQYLDRIMVNLISLFCRSVTNVVKSFVTENVLNTIMKSQR